MTKKPIQIIRYEITVWLNKTTNEPMYGIRVHVTGQGWCGVAVDGKPVFRYSRTEARKYIAGMKKERDKSGYKIAKLQQVRAAP